MKHLFLPYALALLAKEKGFNEDCMCYYARQTLKSCGADDNAFMLTSNEYNNEHGIEVLPAPLYQQIIDWFRENYDIHITIVNAYRLPSKGYYGKIEYHREDILNKPSRYEVRKEIYPNHDRGVEEPGSYYDALNKTIEKVFKLI